MKTVQINVSRIDHITASNYDIVFHMAIFDEDELLRQSDLIIRYNTTKDNIEKLGKKLFQEAKKDWNQYETKEGVLNNEAMDELTQTAQKDLEEYFNKSFITQKDKKNG